MIRREFLVVLAGSALVGRLRTAIRPPRTAKRPLRIVQLGRVRVDDYAWLKPANWKAVWRDPTRLDPEIRRHLEDEERYATDVLAPIEGLRRRLADEMAGWVTPNRDEIVAREAGWVFFSRQPAGATHPRYFRARDGAEELVLDLAARAAGLPFLSVSNVTVSPDGRLLGWAEDRTGAEKRTLFIKDLNTGALSKGPTDAYGDFVFSADSRWLLWTWRDADSRPSRVYRRALPDGADTLVYEEPDPGFLLHLSTSNSRRYIHLRAFNDVTSEVRLIRSDRAADPPVLVEPRREGVIYSLEHWDDGFVVLTNADRALDFKLMRAPEAAPSRASWTPWIPERRGRTVTEIRAFAHRLVRIERVEGNPTLLIRASGSASDTEAKFTEAAYTLKLQPSAYDDQRLGVVFESPRTPPRTLTVDLSTGHQGVARGSAPPNRRSPENYLLQRLHARAADGALVPITLLRRADRSAAPSPLLLTGYGAYGISYETGFSIQAITLVDQGWAWAVAHVRGGSEKGRGWFEAARRLGKKTSFTDFIACAEHLIASGHATRGRIVSFGYSAGGLLVGATLNMRPDLFAGAVGEAPFVDVLGTMSDATHPLVPLTRPVWGDPLANPADYDNIASYSPYDNIAAKPYPPVLASTAVADDRVGFWEPAKWIAKLREKSTSGAPMLLHVAGTGGHAVAEDNAFGEAARLYAFAIWAGDAGPGPRPRPLEPMLVKPPHPARRKAPD